MKTLDLKGLKVFIGIPVGGASIPWQTTNSILETAIALKDRGLGFEVRFVTGCSIVQMARNKVAAEFLRSPANRLFMVDADMQWSAEGFLRMLALSTQMEVVCAAYRMKQDEQCYTLKWDDSKPFEPNGFGCLPIHGTGLGFTVVQREVIERLAAQSPKVRWLGDTQPIPYIFDVGVVDGELLGEDVCFFDRCRAIGYEVNLDPEVTLGHIGTKVYSGTFRDALQPA